MESLGPILELARTGSPYAAGLGFFLLLTYGFRRKVLRWGWEVAETIAEIQRHYTEHTAALIGWYGSMITVWESRFNEERERRIAAEAKREELAERWLAAEQRSAEYAAQLLRDRESPP